MSRYLKSYCRPRLHITNQLFTASFNLAARGNAALHQHKCKGHVISLASAVEKFKATYPTSNSHFIIRLDDVMVVSKLNPRYFNLDTTAYCFDKN